jgi:hypothetical protein
LQNIFEFFYEFLKITSFSFRKKIAETAMKMKMMSEGERERERERRRKMEKRKERDWRVKGIWRSSL